MPPCGAPARSGRLTGSAPFIAMLSRPRLSLVFLLFTPLLSPVQAVPRLAWAVQTEGPIRGAPLVHGPRVYVGSADGALYAVDRASGEVQWKVATGGPIAGAPAVAGDLVIVAGRGDRVLALAAADGTERWTFTLRPALLPPTEWNYFTAPPVIDGAQVLVPAGDGCLYALDVATGRERWRYQTGDALRAAPRVADGVVYQPSGDDYVYALNATDGGLQWKFATDGVGYDLSSGYIRSDIFTRPCLRHGRLCFGSRDGKVYALDPATGTKIWDFSYGGTWAMSAVADDETLYVGWSTNHKISALDLATGAERWAIDAGSLTYTTGLLLDDRVYFGSANGRLVGLDRTTGAERWSYPLGSEIYSSPSHADGTLYAGTDDGRLVAITLDAPSADAAAKAVYRPPVPEAVKGFEVDVAIAPYLRNHGYVSLDSPAALADWLAAHTGTAAPSVVVFAYAQIPPEVLGDDPADGPLRHYLAGGGKVVWSWGMPNRYLFDAAGQFVKADATSAARLLGVSFLGFEDSGNYYARATQAGRNWGLPSWGKASFASLPPDAPVTPLMVDEYGRVSVFVKSFHPRPGSGWVMFGPSAFDVAITPAQLALLEHVAAYGVE